MDDARDAGCLAARWDASKSKYARQMMLVMLAGSMLSGGELGSSCSNAFWVDGLDQG